MMKTKWLVAPALALLLLAAGCGNDQDKKDSSSQKVSTSQSSKKTTKKTASSTSSAATSTKRQSSSSKATSSSASSASSASSSSAKAPGTTTDRLTSLNQQLKVALPGALLPKTVPHSGQLNAAYTGNSSNYVVYYANDATALSFNNPATGANHAAIALRKQTFASAAAAEAQINYQPVAAGSIDVGDNLKAEQQGAAGSTYLTWLEGRWSITVQAINQNNEDPLPTAKLATALLSRAFLPVPAEHGAVNLRVNASGARLNTVTWRSGTTLYTASGVDAISLLRVVTSLN